MNGRDTLHELVMF